MNIDVNVNVSQIEDMKHCIGFDKKMVKRGKYVCWRNYYTTSDINDNWEKLMELGLVVRVPFKYGVGNNPQCYMVIEKGFELLSKILEIKIVEGGT